MSDTPHPPLITVLVNGEPALTVGQAATRHHRSKSAMRTLLHRLRVPQIGKLDDLPLYGLIAIDTAVAAMPGKGANLRGPRKPAQVAATPRKGPPAGYVPYGERKPVTVADSLDDLHGPTTGVISLPITIDWSGTPEKNLDNPGVISRVYVAVLSEAPTADDLNTWLDRDKLLELWPTMYLPAKVRRLWEDRFPELTDTFQEGQ